jgi:hypothetical protein
MRIGGIDRTTTKYNNRTTSRWHDETVVRFKDWCSFIFSTNVRWATSYGSHSRYVCAEITIIDGEFGAFTCMRARVHVISVLHAWGLHLCIYDVLNSLMHIRLLSMCDHGCLCDLSMHASELLFGDFPWHSPYRQWLSYANGSACSLYVSSRLHI